MPMILKGTCRHRQGNPPLHNTDLFHKIAHPVKFIEISPMNHGSKGYGNACLFGGNNSFHGTVEGARAPQHVVTFSPTVKTELNFLYRQPADIVGINERAISKQDTAQGKVCRLLDKGL